MKISQTCVHYTTLVWCDDPSITIILFRKRTRKRKTAGPHTKYRAIKMSSRRKKKMWRAIWVQHFQPGVNRDRCQLTELTGKWLNIRVVISVVGCWNNRFYIHFFDGRVGFLNLSLYAEMYMTVMYKLIIIFFFGVLCIIMWLLLGRAEGFLRLPIKGGPLLFSLFPYRLIISEAL